LPLIEIRELQREDGTAPFADWFDRLPAGTADRIDTALRRIRQGNFGDAKRVGEGVFERRLHFGPGYRIYFGREGDQVVILLAGGTKRTQGRDIEAAKRLWSEYKQARRSRDRWD
jgi:putative addiction module killer protein